MTFLNFKPIIVFPNNYQKISPFSIIITPNPSYMVIVTPLKIPLNFSLCAMLSILPQPTFPLSLIKVVKSDQNNYGNTSQLVLSQSTTRYKTFFKYYNTLQESEDCNALHPKHSVTFPPSVSKMHEGFYNTQLAVSFQIFN